MVKFRASGRHIPYNKEAMGLEGGMSPLRTPGMERKIVKRFSVPATVILLSVILLGPVSPAVAASREGDDLYRKGVRAYRQEDFARAARLFRQLADRGHVKAQFFLGFLYDKGKGAVQDDFEAVRWYRKAAEQGHAAAQSNLGLKYQQGVGGVKNYTKAVKWYRKAAKQNNAVAQYNLGWMYANGKGVPQIHSEALKWYQKAADQGNATAQYNLGLMYANGTGTEQNNVLAHMWSNLASANGVDAARAVRDLVTGKMTPEEVAEAQRRAVEWTPKSGK